jgi:polyisoprenoid-binding protein YceI
MKKLIGIITLFTTVLTLCGDEQLLQIGKAQSKVEVVVNVTAHTFVASLENYDLKITVDTERAKIINTEFSFDFKELKTGKKARDKEMLKWEEYNKYPNCFFILTALHEQGEKVIAEGMLTLHGIEKEIRFPIKVNTAGARWTIHGNTVIDHLDWDLPIIKKLILKVDPNLSVNFHLEGVLN